MAIDYWQLVKDFAQGDAVQKINAHNGQLSPYVGKVTAVFRGTGCLDVQWPFGNERVFSDDVVKVNPLFLRYLPPTLDQSYNTVEIEKAREEDAKLRKASTPLWQHTKFPPMLYVKLAQYWHKGASEVVAYDDLYRSHAPNINDDLLRSEVSKFYLFASNSGELRIQQAVKQALRSKQGAYWVAQNRQYRATGEDIKLGKPACPKCSSRMRQATYKMQEGSKHKIFACPKCLYLIDPTSILGPKGEPHSWFGDVAKVTGPPVPATPKEVVTLAPIPMFKGDAF